MKILLIYPPWLRLFGLSGRHFPLNLGYLATALRRHGHEPLIYNADFDFSVAEGSNADEEKTMSENYDRYITSLQNIEQPIWQELTDTIRKEAPDVVGITSMTAAYGSAVNVAKCVKRVNREITVILGGVHPTLLPEETLKVPEIDIVVRGESEITLVRLLDDIKGKKISSSGIQYGEGKYIVNPLPGSSIKDINDLGFPSRDLLLNSKDCPSSVYGIIMGSRGCPFNCIFCSSSRIWDRKVRFRTAENIIAEIQEVNKTFGTVSFHFEDDTFTLRKDLVMKFCRLIKEKNLRIGWSCPTRVDFITPEIVREMKSSGCDSISLGIESGSEETLMKIKKKITLEQVRRVVRIIKNADVRVMGYFVFGFPWETEEHFEKTLNLIEELDLDIAQYNFAVPLPGTELYRLVESQGLLPPHDTPLDWSRFYQHSPCLPFSTFSDESRKSLIMEDIGKRIGMLNRGKAMLRQREHARESRKRRYKYYMQNPARFADRLYRLIAGAG